MSVSHYSDLMSKRNDGSEAQNHIQEALKLLERSHKATWLRLYDSKSAGLGKGGNYIPEQPADYTYLVKGLSVLLEVKSSDVHCSLSDCTLRSVFSEHQIMGARLWLRAGGVAVCAFYSLQDKTFEFWYMEHVIKAYLSETRHRKLKAVPFALSGNNTETIMKNLLKVEI